MSKAGIFASQTKNQRKFGQGIYQEIDERHDFAFSPREIQPSNLGTAWNSQHIAHQTVLF